MTALLPAAVLVGALSQVTRTPGALGRVVGAHIIRVHDDEASGEYGEPNYIAVLVDQI